MSFDPQNPRGAPRPSTPPPTPPPSLPKPSSYIPPQPVNRGPSIALIAAAVIIAILLLGIVVLLVLNVLKSPAASSTPPSASAPVASHAAPTAAVSPNASSVPSAVPPSTSVISPAPTPQGSVPVGYQEFLAHVPEALRASCLAGQSSSQTISFSAQCTSSDGIIVIYNQYADSASMSAAYQTVFAAQQIDPDTGSCEDHGTWPAEGSYEVENAPAGRRLCADQQGSPTIIWTDERLNFYSSATGPDPVRLIQFWTNEAGPVQ